MREILFRGKRKDNGEWVEGYFGIKDGYSNEKIYCIMKPTFDMRMEYSYFTDYEVIPETVGQYTGLTDKYGKKIFEGDILDCGDRIVYVKWHDNCGTWDSVFIKYIGERCSNGIVPVEWKYRAVVIGNIHEPPELIIKL